MQQCLRPHGILVRLSVLALACVSLQADLAAAEGLSSAWIAGPNARTRLIAGIADATRPGLRAGQPVVGLDIMLAPGWKTYWRHPGDAGGVPPYVSFEGSSNLKSAEFLFPAPQRLVDASGEAIGYKGNVVFPIAVTPADATRPVGLKVRIEYGICREICIPAEASHAIEIPPGLAASTPAVLNDAVARVPQAAAGGPVPSLVAGRRNGTMIEVDVRYPGGTAAADLFAEAPEGAYVPMPQRIATPAPDMVRYAIALGSATEAANLVGKSLQLTMVGASAASTTPFVVP